MARVGLRMYADAKNEPVRDALGCVMVKLLLVDNYDSFTFNLAQSFQVLGAEVVVVRNDRLALSEADSLTAPICVFLLALDDPRMPGFQ